MTMPSLIAKHQEKAIVTALLKFNSVLSQAVLYYRTENGDMTYGSGNDSDANAFEEIAKNMKFVNKCTLNKAPSCSSASWLPDYNLNYYGQKVSSGYALVAKRTSDAVCYMLPDGIRFCVDVDGEKFNVAVDVNGTKPPDRAGQDIFYFTVGYKNKDVQPGYYYTDSVRTGLCPLTSTCNPNNVDPTKYGGASPTSYVLLNHKLPPKYSR